MYGIMADQSINESLEAIRKGREEALKLKENAIKFLQDAGILDENGELAEEFRDTGDAEENNKNWLS
jgi:hypothetical protein